MLSCRRDGIEKSRIRHVRVKWGEVGRVRVWSGVMWYGNGMVMVWYWYGLVWYDTVWYGMIWYGFVWHGNCMVMVRYGRVWYGKVCCGMVMYGMVW